MSEAAASEYEDVGELGRAVAKSGDVPRILRAATLLEHLQEWDLYQSLLASALEAQRLAGHDKAAQAETTMALAKSRVACYPEDPKAYAAAMGAYSTWKDLNQPEQTAEAAILVLSTHCGG